MRGRGIQLLVTESLKYVYFIDTEFPLDDIFPSAASRLVNFFPNEMGETSKNSPGTMSFASYL